MYGDKLNDVEPTAPDGTGWIASMYHNNPINLLESIEDIQDDV
jgi:hypothetical protein